MVGSGPRATAPSSAHSHVPGSEATQTPRFGKLVGRSAPMRKLFAVLWRSAKTDASILIEGEPGTGKEASAEAIHRASPRSRGPFIVIECGASPPSALEHDLFGSEGNGATGGGARPGAFESADHGTLFLDDVGELGLDLQAKVLRTLEKKQIKRMGGSAYIPIDVRLVAATTRSLEAAAAENCFRADLFYRLAVVKVKVPPLRERLEDLPVLVDHEIVNLGIGHTAEANALRSPAFLADLASHAWPGNVRQLRSHLERCAALGDVSSPRSLDVAEPSTAGDTAPEAAIDVSQPLRLAREGWVATFEHRYLEALLARHRNNVSAAARAAGIDRIHLYRLLWKHGLRSHESESVGGKR
jgi:two-component system, NtrC family, response regulator GlrR